MNPIVCYPVFAPSGSAPVGTFGKVTSVAVSLAEVVEVVTLEVENTPGWAVPIQVSQPRFQDGHLSPYVLDVPPREFIRDVEAAKRGSCPRCYGRNVHQLHCSAAEPQRRYGP